MATTLTTVDAALKEFYLPGVREQLNNECMFLAQIEKGSENVEGRRAVLSLHVTRNSGVGAIAEGGTLPTAGNQGYVEERVGMKYNYGRIQINGPVIRAMKSDRGSFVRAVESEMTGLTNDLKRSVNRQLYNDANQVLAQTDTTSSSTEVELATTTTAVQMRQFYIGQLVDIGTTADPDSVVAASAITAIDTNLATASITISDSVSTNNSTHYVSAAGSAGNEITGLREIVLDSGTLFNVNPSNYPVWKSTVNDNSGTGRNATDTLFEYVIDEVQLQSGVYPNFIVASHGVVRNYAAQLQADRRYTNPLDLQGGYKAVGISVGSSVQIPLMAERDCPAETAFILDISDFKLHRQSDWEWMQEDGAVLNRVANTDAYEATLFLYAELAISNRNHHAKIVDLNETTS